MTIGLLFVCFTYIVEEHRCVKEEICNLKEQLSAETIRVTLRRKNLWLDYVGARNNNYNPCHLIKITFCGEPAIDDGGPKREFFTGNDFDTSLLLVYCVV